MAEYYGVEYENPEEDPLKEDLDKIMAQNDMTFAPDSKEYRMMKSAHKYLRRNYSIVNGPELSHASMPANSGAG